MLVALKKLMARSFEVLDNSYQGVNCIKRCGQFCNPLSLLTRVVRLDIVCHTAMRRAGCVVRLASTVTRHVATALKKQRATLHQETVHRAENLDIKEFSLDCTVKMYYLFMFRTFSFPLGQGFLERRKGQSLAILVLLTSASALLGPLKDCLRVVCLVTRPDQNSVGHFTLGRRGSWWPTREYTALRLVFISKKKLETNIPGTGLESLNVSINAV